jgi:hypothetical protein
MCDTSKAPQLALRRRRNATSKAIGQAVVRIGERESAKTVTILPAFAGFSSESGENWLAKPRFSRWLGLAEWE